MENVVVNSDAVTVNGTTVTVDTGIELRFWKAAPATGDLLFGDSETPAVQHVEATLDTTLPALTFTARAIPDARASLIATLPALTFAADGTYTSRTQRPTVGATSSDWQKAVFSEEGARDGFEKTAHTNTGAGSDWQAAEQAASSARATHTSADRIKHSRSTRFQQATPHVSQARTARHQNADRVKQSRSSRFQKARDHISQSRSSRYEDTIRSSRITRSSRYQEAVPVKRYNSEPFNAAQPFDFWFTTLAENAMRPPAGEYTPVVPPVNPEPEWTADLLFAKLFDGSTDILFGWTGEQETIVVPVRSVYMVINDVSLRRVSNNLYLPPLSFSLKIDRDSWTWGFSASFPLSVQADLEPNSAGDPVELEASINGTAYRVIVESISRDRSFASGAIAVTGRGKSAFLDSPYAASRSYTNTEARTAQQLMADVLTLNSTSIGWEIDWNITDWLIPAGAWAHQGSYIDALKTIANAAGAYLQPHATQQRISVMPAYPAAPWEWDSLTPDFELPAALTTREGIEWVEKARYNAIYLQGSVLGHVKRSGTAGDVLAPMIVDPLLTHVDAHRQRGIAVLGDTGRIANVSLRIPVLSETGIITPGKTINYVDDGVERFGIVRSTDISVGYPEVFQTIGVETHA